MEIDSAITLGKFQMSMAVAFRAFLSSLCQKNKPLQLHLCIFEQDAAGLFLPEHATCVNTEGYPVSSSRHVNRIRRHRDPAYPIPRRRISCLSKLPSPRARTWWSFIIVVRHL